MLFASTRVFDAHISAKIKLKFVRSDKLKEIFTLLSNLKRISAVTQSGLGSDKMNGKTVKGER